MSRKRNTANKTGVPPTMSAMVGKKQSSAMWDQNLLVVSAHKKNNALGALQRAMGGSIYVRSE